MSNSRQTKNVKLTEEAHERLMQAKLEVFGATSMHAASFSDVVIVLTEKMQSGARDDE